MKYLIDKHLKKIVFSALIINIIIIMFFKPSCPWEKNLNIDCAGCGATRMVKSLFVLDFYQAFRFNPLLFCLLIVLILYGIYILICKIKHKTYYKIKQRDLWLLLIFVILFMILRNIPTFYYLKPTVVR